jgi:hypothetical protein
MPTQTRLSNVKSCKTDQYWPRYWFSSVRSINAASVGNNRSGDGNVNKKYEEEIDDEGFITVRTKKTKREMMKRSKTVTWKDIESKKCKSVSRAILLKQSS